MTVPMGGNRINPHPCTEQEELQNWQNTSIYVSNIQNNIDVIEGDIENIENTYYNDPDQLFSDITLDGATYNSSTNTLTIETGGGGVDNFTVKVTTDDSVASFLHDAFHLNATYDSDEDLLVATATVGSGGTNQQERLFVDMDIVTGYSATGNHLLGSKDDVTQFDSIEDWLKELADYNSGATVQVVGHAAGTVGWRSNFCLPRIALVTESGGVAAAVMNGSDISPASGSGTLYTRPATPGNDWADAGAVTLYHVGGDVVEEGQLVVIDDEGLIIGEYCTHPA